MDEDAGLTTKPAISSPHAKSLEKRDLDYEITAAKLSAAVSSTQ